MSMRLLHLRRRPSAGCRPAAHRAAARRRRGAGPALETSATSGTRAVSPAAKRGQAHQAGLAVDDEIRFDAGQLARRVVAHLGFEPRRRADQRQPVDLLQAHQCHVGRLRDCRRRTLAAARARRLQRLPKSVSDPSQPARRKSVTSVTSCSGYDPPAISSSIDLQDRLPGAEDVSVARYVADQLHDLVDVFQLDLAHQRLLGLRGQHERQAVLGAERGEQIDQHFLAARQRRFPASE